MVVNRDVKRKRKVNTCINFLDESPKRTKVHAQRKFAQGSNVSSPVITPVKEIERQERNRDILPEPTELLPIKRPNTEDFLTFLCFRGTPILPSSLNFFNTASMIDTRVQTDEPKNISPKNGPIVTHTFNKTPNERPFIAFGVRKRADPIVISKQMDKKRRHALALQALRRKYQEQKMAKIRAVTISKLSEKVTSKSVVRTRSVTKNETITKKSMTHKTNIKVVATKHITTRTTIKQPIRNKVKSKMCLRSFRGRYIHHELGVRKHKKKPLTKKIIKVPQEKKEVQQRDEEAEEISSEFSSDDDEPLVKTAKPKSSKYVAPKTAKKSAPGPKKPIELNYRLTRSHRMLLNNQLSTKKQAMKQKRFFSKQPGSLKSSSTKIINKKIIQSSRILKNRIGQKSTSMRNKKIHEKKIAKIISKSVTKSSERIQTRSEPKRINLKLEEKNNRNLRQNLTVGKKKEETTEKRATKKEELKKNIEKNEKHVTSDESKKSLKDAIETKSDKKLPNKIETPKINNKDKCDEGLKKVAVVKISKEESEKTDESEKLISKKEEVARLFKEKTSEVIIRISRKGDNKKNDEVDIKTDKAESKKNVAKFEQPKSDEGESESSSVNKKPTDKIESQKVSKKELEKNCIVEKQNFKKAEVVKTSKDDKKIAKDKNEKLEKESFCKEKLDERKITKAKTDKLDEIKLNKQIEKKTSNDKTEKPELRKDKIDKSKAASKTDKAEELSKITISKKPEKSKKLEEPEVKLQEKLEPRILNSRPTRKTKEAAAIYMEILGHKLVNDAEIDDDDTSIDSFPELPNVRKTEQRENELKAKAKSKTNDSQEIIIKKNKSADKNVAENNEPNLDQNDKKHVIIAIENIKTNEKSSCSQKKCDPDVLPETQVQEKSEKEESKKLGKKVVEEKKENLGKRKSLHDCEKINSDLDDNLKKQKLAKKTGDVEKPQQKKKFRNLKPVSVDIEKRQTRFQTAKPFFDMSFSDSDESFTIDMKICGTIEPKQTRKKANALDKKLPEITPAIPKTEENLTEMSLPKVSLKSQNDTTVDKDIKIVEKDLIDDENKSIDSDQSSVQSKTERNKKKVKSSRVMRKQLDQSFSDSDEEPLSKFTQLKGKKVEQVSLSKRNIDDSSKSKTSKEKNEKLEEVQYVGKPRRECTKRPQNYLPLFSSSDDEEKYFHGFVKTETKTLKDIRNEEEKCAHALLSSDLLCKDVGRRFGKGKVNMSKEQIEKWLNDSVMAGMSIKKENDEMLKFGEKTLTETSLDPTNIDADKLKSSLIIMKVEDPNKGDVTLKSRSEPVSASSTSEKQTMDKPVPKPIVGERKTIFRKEKSQPIRNINAFSASNESSVYAFQAENEDSVSTPFRRPSRRPSSTATSKSEEETSKLEDVSKSSGKFRLPTTVKADIKSSNRQEMSLTLSADDSNSTSIAVQVNLESTEIFPDVSNADVPVDPENNEQMFYIPLGKQTSSQNLIQGVSIKMGTEGKSGTNQKLVMRAKLVTQSPAGAQKLEEKLGCSASMFPPANTLQKAKPDGKFQYKCTSNRSSDRMSETSEDFKYKVPSSPSASSSSSTKLYKRQKARCQPMELCTPVQVSEFPSDHCLAQMVEAPVFYPTEKEFQDPIEYIEKIRCKANRFGICRIVPPSNFKPECKVSDDMRFTAYNQYVHKMLHRWGPNFKELMAIKKYLQTQNITLTHPPWIGGMEIDLPRLYQTVQLLGGLKEVIEKKRWPKVSEAMKIPKSAQDRLTKLDDIYCKYLLPYDTLSPAEREKLFDEVETEWAKRESKTLLKVQQKVSKCETGSESESDPDDESEECIVKGRNMALNAFYRIARNTMSMWFKTTEPLAYEVEQEFWKHVTVKNNHICVHSGSIDSGNWGYGFAVSKNSPFARHAWNLKVLTNNSGSVLRSMGPLMGVTVPTLHVGMVFSACCWYRDPHSLPWIEYLHTGANKIWYGIPDSMSNCFHSTLLKLVPNYCKNKSLWLPSDTVMIPPNLLVENGVSLSRTVQEPGQFIVVFPKVFTSSISTGYVVSESVYFAPPYWLESAQIMFNELKNSREPSMFSLDRLILSISSDPRSNIDVLKQIIPAVQLICVREQKFRDKLTDLGLNVREKLPLPEAPAIRKRKKLQDDNGDYECDICRANLFISLVAESQDDVIYCLEHASSQIEDKKIEAKNCKLLFTYDDEELKHLVEQIKSTIDVKLHKKLPGKYAGMPTMLK